MQIKIDSFHGIQPRLHPSLLGDGMAIEAHNCRLKSGKIVPMKRPTVSDGVESYFENGLADSYGAKSMHIWRETDGSFAFLLFPGVTWAASGNVADDRLTRLVVSGETGVPFGSVNNTPVLYVRREGTREKVRVAIARTALDVPIVRRVSDSELTDAKLYTRFFATWVDEFGIESPPSPPSLLYDGTDGNLEYMDGDMVALRISGAIPSAATLIRLYKVISGNEDGYRMFVKEFDASAFSGGAEVFIQEKDENAGEVMPEIEAPLADLSCIHNVPGSFYVGFSPSSPKTVCFSEVDLLYSWPVAYRYDIPDNIASLAVTGNTVFALTDGWPYVLTGTSPESMTVSKIAGPAACVSPRGVCTYRNNVYFSSNAGLMSIANDSNAGTVCVNVTDKIFTKEQWKALNPSSCLMEQNDGALYMFFTLADGTHRNIILDLNESSSAVTTHDIAASCLVVDGREGEIHYVNALEV